ncbi:hypothetical protein OH77DRAFT_1436137 [Trametes cingulata]|nr:hypothetical protein OH77DRAFT_1436137 [Trametes cingulata]
MTTAATHPPSLRAFGVAGSDSSRSSLERAPGSVASSEAALEERVDQITTRLDNVERRVNSLTVSTTRDFATVNAKLDDLTGHVTDLTQDVRGIQSTVNGHREQFGMVWNEMVKQGDRLSGYVESTAKELEKQVAGKFKKNMGEMEQRLQKRIDDTGRFILRHLEQRTDNKIAALESRMDSKFAALEGRMDETDKNINEMKGQIAGMGTRMDKMETHMAGMGTRMDRMETQIADMGTQMARMETQITDLQEGFVHVNKTLEMILARLEQLPTTGEPLPATSPYLQGAADSFDELPSPTSQTPAAATSTPYLSVPGSAHPAAASAPTLRRQRSLLDRATHRLRDMRGSVMRTLSRVGHGLDAVQRDIEAVRDEAVPPVPPVPDEHQPSTAGSSSRSRAK